MSKVRQHTKKTMNLNERVENQVDRINRLKDRTNIEMCLMSIINYLVEGEFDKHKVFNIISHYTINANDFNIKIIVELIKTYCQKNGVDEETILNQFDKFLDYIIHLASQDFYVKFIDEDELNNAGFKSFGLKQSDFKTIFFHAIDTTTHDESINNDVYLFCRDNWRLIKDIRGPLLKTYFDDFTDKYNKKRLNRKEFLKNIKQYTGEPTTKWVNGSTQKLYNLKPVYEQHFEQRETNLFNSIVEGSK